MGDNTAIQWTDATWNPVTGCSKISPGCASCYAETMARRLKAMGLARYRDGFAVRCHPEALEEPLRWRKPRRVFVVSMGDLFHDEVPDEFINDVLSMIDRCPQHVFQILTKRPARMRAILTAGSSKPRANLWAGVTAEDQQRADERIPLLLETPAAVRFVSVEPMVGPVDLTAVRIPGAPSPPFQGNAMHSYRGFGERIDWVIAGCESGPRRRPADLDWFRSLRDQCVEAGVPFFLKQAEDGCRRCGGHEAVCPMCGGEPGPIVKMPALDGRVWDQVPAPGGGAP